MKKIILGLIFVVATAVVVDAKAEGSNSQNCITLTLTCNGVPTSGIIVCGNTTEEVMRMIQVWDELLCP